MGNFFEKQENVAQVRLERDFGSRVMRYMEQPPRKQNGLPSKRRPRLESAGMSRDEKEIRLEEESSMMKYS